jgi:hypothetical protein
MGRVQQAAARAALRVGTRMLCRFAMGSQSRCLPRSSEAHWVTDRVERDAILVAFRLTRQADHKSLLSAARPSVAPTLQKNLVNGRSSKKASSRPEVPPWPRCCPSELRRHGSTSKCPNSYACSHHRMSWTRTLSASGNAQTMDLLSRAGPLLRSPSP